MRHRSIGPLLAGCLAAGLVIACAGPEAAESVTPSPSGAAEPSAPDLASVAPSAATASPTPAAGNFAITWTEEAFDEPVSGIAVDGDRIVAVGKADTQFTAWTSTDGASWEAFDVPPPTNIVSNPENMPENVEAIGSLMGGLIRLNETLYSFGTFNFMDFVRPVGWRWTDGEPWAFIDSDSDFYASGRVVDAVATEDGIVAARLEVALSWAGVDSTMWRWTPDTSWVQADLSHPNADRAYVSQVARSDGALLASGLIPVEDPDDPDGAAAALWESSDGQTWSAIEPPAGSDQICALEADEGGGFVAVGTGANGISAWRYTDGQWSESGLSASAPAHPETGEPFFDVCWAFQLADGMVVLFQTDEGLNAWTSVDGTAWVDGGIVTQNAWLAAAGEDHIVLVRAVDFTDSGSGSTILVGRVGP